MSVQHKNEDIVGGLSVDISLRRAGSGSTDLPTVIEVDGPFHYLKNERGDTKKIWGVYLLKDRLLKKQGYSVLHVPYFEWNPLKDDDNKRKYLEKLLSL